ncbi:MAG: hypothetical protein AAB817_01550, partial [Patescibacteria group bacterium]
MSPIKNSRSLRYPKKNRLTRELESIYEDGSGRVADISRLEPTRHRGLMRSLLIFGGALAALTAVAWLGWWMFQQYAPDTVKQFLNTQGDISITIEAPTEAKPGAIVTYIIRYRNQGSVAIDQATLNVRYPAGWLLTAQQPAADGGPELVSAGVARREDTWQLGKLATGAATVVRISGIMNAPEGTTANLWVVLTYVPANFSSTFQTEASATTTIAAAPVVVELQGQEQVTASDPYILTIHYGNPTDQALTDINIIAKYPSSFTVKKIEPAGVDQSKNRWRIAELAVGKSGDIVISGNFAANATGDQLITVTTTQTSGDVETTLSEKIKTITLVSGEVLMELQINGSNETAAVNFGDTLSYTLTYQNNGQQALKDISAAVFFTSSAEVISWPALQDRYDGTLDEFEAGKFITWTKQEVPNLAELKPGEKGVIDFTVKLSSSAGELSGDINLQSVATLTIGKFGAKPSNLQLHSNSVKVLLNSNAVLTAAGRYFGDDGASIGSGPIPPAVGQSTNYIINWTIQNSVHEIRDVTVLTVLPEGVVWSGARTVAVGSIEYEPANRRVVWSINRIPTTLNLNYQASFEIGITPLAKDVGKVLALTGDQTFKATDAVTSAPISQTRGSITTDLTA